MGTAARGRPRTGVLLRICAASVLIVLWVLTAHTADGQALDARTFHWAAPLNDEVGDGAHLMRRGLPVLTAATVLVLASFGARDRRWDALAWAGFVVAAAGGTAFAARSLLVRPDLGDHGYAYNTFPSLNVAVVAALGVAAAILWPGAGRRIMLVVGAAVAVLAAFASVVTYAHRGSDVVGALLLVVVLAPSLAWRDVTRATAQSHSGVRTPS